jgi:hypothetical protein
MILKIFSPKNVAKILAFLLKLVLVFLQKIVENCDHNIGPPVTLAGVEGVADGDFPDRQLRRRKRAPLAEAAPARKMGLLPQQHQAEALQ